MNFFDYFQIASVVIFLFILVGKILYLRLSRNVNPIAIGGGKKGVVLALELISIVGLMVWMVEALLHASHSGFRIFSAKPSYSPARITARFDRDLFLAAFS